MITFQCPNCKATHEVPDAHAGKFARCGCGSRVQVPGPKGARAPKPSLTIEAAAFAANCPSCNALMDEGVVVCVSCGFNRVTGVKIRTEVGGDEARGPDPDATREGPLRSRPRSVPVIKYAIVAGIVLVLAAGGWFLYSRFAASGSGVDDDAPLGTIERLEKRFLGTMKMHRNGPQKRENGGSIYVFEDPLSPEGMRGFHEKIRLLTDSEGAVRGIVATLAPSGTAERLSPMSKSAGHFFFFDYWEEITGERPKFRIRSEGAGAFEITIETASFTKGSIEGKWLRGNRVPSDSVAIGYSAEVAFLKTLP